MSKFVVGLWLLSAGGLSIGGLSVAAEPQCPAALRTYHLYDRTGQTLSCLDNWQQQFFRDLGCPLTMLDYNPAPAVKEQALQHGKVELLVGLSQHAGRSFQFSQPFACHRYQFYHRQDDLRWQDIRSLCDATMQRARIIIPAQSYLGGVVEQLRSRSDCAKSIASLDAGFGLALEMLDKQRADLLYSSDLWLKRMKPEVAARYQPLPFYVWHDELRIAFSTQIPVEFVNKVNRQLALQQSQQRQICDLSPPAS
jgi:hypothetical protein